MPLWQGYQRFYNATIAEETSALTWRRFLDPAEPMHAALAWRGDVATGQEYSVGIPAEACYLFDAKEQAFPRTAKYIRA